MKGIFWLLAISVFAIFDAQAQESTFPVNGVDDYRSGHYAFTGATIYQNGTTKLSNATLIIKDGYIQQVGQGLSVPAGAIEVDASGRTIYPSFIDLHANYGAPAIDAQRGNWYDAPQMVNNAKGAYGWNQAIRAEFDNYKEFVSDKGSASPLIKAGFGAVLSHRHDGIVRGSGAFVSLVNAPSREALLKDRASSHLSFSKGSSTQDYPGSRMGAIALLKQTYHDARWYAGLKQPEEFNISLQSFNALQSLPTFFEANDNLNVFRADLIGDEFKQQYIMIGSGEEYQRLNELKATNAAFIIPLTYPEAYDVEDPFDASFVNLADMKHWEMAPANARFLHEAGIEFSFTADGLDNVGDFLKQVRKAVEYGLKPSAAIDAMTSVPARLIGVDNMAGQIKKGQLANFLVCSGDLFDESTVVYENWVKGQKHVLKDFDHYDIRGTYSLNVGNKNYELSITGEADAPSAKIVINDSTDFKVNLKRERRLVSMDFNDDKDNKMNTTRLSGVIAQDWKSWKGQGETPDGQWINWSAAQTAGPEAKEEKAAEEAYIPEIGSVIYPFVAYGNESIPTDNNYLLTNATVWTNEEDGVLENTDVLIKNGKIAAIGKDLSAADAQKVDASDMHITAGIIDEHSHICISAGVNEWTQASSAEVSIATVVNSEDINMYRQLAGGVTTSQLLHGSANPIGGQSAVVKFRWGQVPEVMKYENMPKFIKFALGENVKQANWGPNNQVRFPQTRMGVEQVYVNYFTKAKEYEAKWAAHKALGKKAGPAPRRDLELETLAEIINSKRFITCHSYVQSEINMLMKVAESFDFRVNTFTHILEGYKVADKMKDHGVHASTFSDWWAYKYEVIDAIPHNAAIMHEVGVNVGINSDDAEMGRRLNQEAAKAVKYGGVSEEEALKMVTLNPAKMLRIDDRVGSIKVGKDADVVIWTDHPLSVYAKAAKTFVDGVCYYDMESDIEKREAIAAERQRLIQKMIAVKANGGKTIKPVKPGNSYYNCASGTTIGHCHVH